MAQRVSNGRATGSRVVANQIVEIAAAYATQTAIPLVRPCNAAAAQFTVAVRRSSSGIVSSGVRIPSDALRRDRSAAYDALETRERTRSRRQNTTNFGGPVSS